MSADFLAEIWGDLLEPLRFGEVRCIKDGKLSQSWHHDAQSAFEAAQRRNEAGFDAYFGVLPRTRMGGTAADTVDRVHVLWADIDAKKVSPILEEGKWRALVALNSFPLEPQIVVDSGGGYHAYWRLREDIAYESAREAMVWIADLLKGDHVQDSPRVLRVPGTINWKREPFVPARLLRFDITKTTRWSDVLALLPIPRPPRQFTGPRERVEDLPEWLSELITVGAPKGERSETCFRAILWLLRYGRTSEEIEDLFVDHDQGIGAKYAEKGRDGARWLRMTIAAAEKAV
jgi:putative DNA primase/helicase